MLLQPIQGRGGAEMCALDAVDLAASDRGADGDSDRSPSESLSKSLSGYSERSQGTRRKIKTCRERFLSESRVTAAARTRENSGSGRAGPRGTTIRVGPSESARCMVEGE